MERERSCFPLLYKRTRRNMNNKTKLILVGLGIFQLIEASTVADSRPNIVFCIADDASYHHFSGNGCTWVNTPAFDKIGKEGIRFTNCYTPNAKSAAFTCMYSDRKKFLAIERSWKSYHKFSV